MSDLHGWGTDSSALSLMEHATKKGKVALMLTAGQSSKMVAEFTSVEDALDVQDWLDGAFASARAMNGAVLETASKDGLLPPKYPQTIGEVTIDALDLYTLTATKDGKKGVAISRLLWESGDGREELLRTIAQMLVRA